MTFGRIINGIAYIHLLNEDCLKNESLESNIYFTLRDIWANGHYDYLTQANVFNVVLSNGISYEYREDDFKYSNCLNDVTYLKNIIHWLKSIKTLYWFDFEELEEGEEIDMNEYMPAAYWWENKFKHLIILLDNRLIELINSNDQSTL